ncbi:MAG TPA: hypothetical protein VK501_14980 [Baekduia sp.]|uniref:hypothetical protein n=1 Tax=Baekduia sp. TaxID=2600305 RepID=UPI002B7F7642|nr:hypothetical protein [Baekduia sp.]HMJ35213.1 hypothetical protein [Baekduia sp.]
MECTTELPEYWLTLAAYAPQQCLDTVAEFAGEPSVDPTAIFGDCDPLASSTTPEDRATAFQRTMLACRGRSPYNTGAKAICCMVQSTNTLEALAALTRAALRTCTVTGPDAEPLRCLSAADVLPLMRGLAEPGRASDPLLVERLTRLAWDGRLVAFDDPVGVYIRGVEHHRLRTPAGHPVPAEWFTLTRGTPANAAPDGRARHQRVAFEVPPEEGDAVGELIDVATEEPIVYGGQVAELLQLSVYLRVSDAAAAPPQPMATMGADAVADGAAADGCNELHAHYREYAR